MSWPLLNFVEGSSVGSWATSRSAANMPGSPLFIGLLPRFRARLILGLVDVEQAHPREAHFINRALAISNPVARVRVVLVGGRVVVPRGDVNDRSGRQNRRDVVGVRVRDVPAELVVADAVQRLGSRRART